jgi:hypothetical protein
MENGTKTNGHPYGHTHGYARSQVTVYAVLAAALFLALLVVVGGTGTLLWKALK